MTGPTWKLITAVMPKEAAAPILKTLKDDHGIIAAYITNARGAGRLTPLAYRGVGEQSEKEILTVMVDAESADEIFKVIYTTANINRPHGGIMYMQALGPATLYALPEIGLSDEIAGSGTSPQRPPASR